LGTLRRYAMLFSGIERRRGSAAVLALLCAVAALAACKHNMKGTADTRGLWIANGNNVVEFVPGQLVGGVQNVAPHRNISSGALGTPQGVTFDAAGNLWVLDPGAMVNGTATPALLK